jgi:hypothetical protein
LLLLLLEAQAGRCWLRTLPALLPLLLAKADLQVLQLPCQQLLLLVLLLMLVLVPRLVLLLLLLLVPLCKVRLLRHWHCLRQIVEGQDLLLLCLKLPAHACQLQDGLSP